MILERRDGGIALNFVSRRVSRHDPGETGRSELIRNPEDRLISINHNAKYRLPKE